MIVKYKSLTKKQKYEYIANQMKLAEKAYLKKKEEEAKRAMIFTFTKVLFTLLPHYFTVMVLLLML